MKRLQRWPILLASAMLLAACGGNVNLGNRSAPDSAPDEMDPAAQADPLLVPSQRVLPIAPGDYVSSMAVFGDHLYLGMSSNGDRSGLLRCQKASCERSLERLAAGPASLQALQVVDQRLGVLAGNQDWWIGTLALPNGTDKQVVIDRLPAVNNTRPLFLGGYVFWTMAVDQNLYRCTLPDCVSGPKKITRYLGPTAYGDGDSIFVPADGAIARIGALGDGLVERLLPDASLSPAADKVDVDAQGQVYAFAIAATAGRLYAAVQRGGTGCPNCDTTLSRWPAAGGPREDLLVTKDRVKDLFAFGSELVWLAQDSENSDVSMLVACHTDTCATTLRHLGSARSDLSSIVADDQRLYWLQAAYVPDQRFFRDVAIRSVSLSTYAD